MRLPDKPPLSPKHREERLKLAANGLQNLALALFAGVLIAPVLNPALIAPLPVRLAAVALAGLAVLVARRRANTKASKYPGLMRVGQGSRHYCARCCKVSSELFKVGFAVYGVEDAE